MVEDRMAELQESEPKMEEGKLDNPAATDNTR
jgi:hypothetical protein